MKNAVFCIVLFVNLFVFFACVSPPPAPAPTPAPAAPPPPPPEPPRAAAPSRATDLVLDGASSYTVAVGDTLSRISKSFYKNSFYYPLIMMASKDIVKDQDYILPGTALIIPRLQANLDDARARESMKKYFLEIANITNRKRPGDAAGLRKLANEL